MKKEIEVQRATLTLSFLRRPVLQVMYHLRGHPNIIELHGVYEDRNNVHLVMDLCNGSQNEATSHV